MTRSLADIEAALARLDARLTACGSFEAAEQEESGLLDRLAALYRERDHALNAQSAEGEERPQEAA
ncbi:MAG: hypothetical protein A3F84_25165 [Candidatus Handelsmanbacteria bacterium RIFCSPLOWO2_12_FULL_64_10]|uniref:Uncharacterized protein n=1 Tax=Handelsmanbacteria sp. (strain RIFCSPLOWO2_12_FULL_64_10) TaxID=1817868 RepID=A0A1F6CBY2_HANXR|nr:MAG: hypothetical protein A3F84_25165 [Candidatus Handelsmanbacteria bacterium RIFCSPLOWO2_12_FULL_64_10]